MRAKRARDIRKAVKEFIINNNLKMKDFQRIYRRTKKNYNIGIA